MEIDNKTFVVTGAASGLGLATAQMLVTHGANVLLLDINEPAGEQAAQSLGEQAIFVKTDVTDEQSTATALDAAVQKWGALHGAVSCAGIGPSARILGKNRVHPLEDFSKVVQINLTGTFNVLRLAAEKMQVNTPGKSGERGVIITTASVAAFDGQIGQAAYSASKGGIAAMTLPAARELARFGIRVMCIAPGIFETPLMDNLSEEVKLSLGQQTPFPSRLGQPSEFAALVQHILENQMLNGETIRLDGAIRMAAK